jgi:oligopeptide/dipeptide ABC transporter ATP-binding protein
MTPTDREAPPAKALLDVRDLKTHFRTEGGIVRAVDGVSFQIAEGETLAVVGESGSGKSVTSLSVMGLVPKPYGYIPEGEILFRGEDLLKKTPDQMRRMRGSQIGMIFQEPMTSLNPVHSVGQQISEAVLLHQRCSKAEAARRVVEMLELVGIPEPKKRAESYPHQMSGGMRQRVMIAMALSCNPKLLIADEPTTALDVTIQAQILDLMRKLQAEMGMAILFITHDLGVVAEMADRVVVMYAGRAVEQGTCDEIFADPKMPYTAGLMNSIPRSGGGKKAKRLRAIPGNVPDPLKLPPGCAFRARCAHARPVCAEAMPPLDDSGGGHLVRCVRWKEIDLKAELVA